MRIVLLVLTLLAFASPLHAYSLSGLGALVAPPDQKWLIGSQTSSIAPPSGLSKTEKTEWKIGVIVAAGEMCGYYAKAAEVSSFMKLSPHFKQALTQMNRFHFVKGCGSYGGYLDDVLAQKSYWERHVKLTYRKVEKNDLLSRAEHGDAAAQYTLGQNYAAGYGVQMSSAEARSWFLKAAENGHPEAQYKTGVYYEKGHTVGKNQHEALRWYRKAAAQKNARAQYKVGLFYEQGWVIQKDLEEARNWYRKAASQGHAFAGVSLRRLREKTTESTSQRYADSIIELHVGWYWTKPHLGKYGSKWNDDFSVQSYDALWLSGKTTRLFVSVDRRVPGSGSWTSSTEETYKLDEDFLGSWNFFRYFEIGNIVPIQCEARECVFFTAGENIRCKAFVNWSGQLDSPDKPDIISGYYCPGPFGINDIDPLDLIITSIKIRDSEAKSALSE